MAHEIYVPDHPVGPESATRIKTGDEVTFRLTNAQDEQVRLELVRWATEEPVVLQFSTDDDGASVSHRIGAGGLYRYRILDADKTRRVGYLVSERAESLMAYTIIPRISGTISTWAEHLDRVEGLGCNAVQLLPLTEMGPSRSPYAVSDHFAIDPSLASAEDPEGRIGEFESFVGACSDRNIAVGVDLVLNHVALGGRTAAEHPEWLELDSNSPDGFRRAGWWDGYRWNRWEDLIRIDYYPFAEAEREGLWEYMSRYALFWSRYAAESGGFIRIDNMHSADPGFLSHLLRQVYREYPDARVLGELFADERTIFRMANGLGVDAILSTTWEHRFLPELRSYLRYIHRNSSRICFHTPVNSHDSGSMTEEFGTPDALYPRYATVALLAGDHTGLVQSTEYGIAERPAFIGPVEPAVWLSDAPRYGEFIKSIHTLVRENPAFRARRNVLFVDGNHNAILAGVRLDPSTGLPAFLVCANFDTGNEQRIEIPFHGFSRVRLKSVLDEESIRLDGHPLRLTLEAGGVRVYAVEAEPRE